MNISRLTPRELQIFKLARIGMRRKEIGKALGISENTADIHMTHIYAKLGVRGMKALAKILIVGACMAFAQTSDPIPDKLRTDIFHMQRDRGKAESAIQAAMMALTAAQTNRDAINHNLNVLQGDAERRCTEAGRKYDSDQVACVVAK